MKKIYLEDIPLEEAKARLQSALEEAGLWSVLGVEDITLDEKSASDNFQLALEFGEELIYQSDGKTGISTALYPGDYFLKVTGNGGLYVLNIEAVAEKREFEPNNGIKFANTLVDSQTKNASLYSSQDSDYFGFQATESGLFDIMINSEFKLNIELRNIADFLIKSFSNTDESGALISNWSTQTPLKTGQYYLRITGTGPGKYSIAVSGGIAVVNKLMSLTIFPDQLQDKVSIGDSLTFTCLGYYLDGSESDHSADVDWESNDESIVSMSEYTAFAHAEGTATITAKLQGNFASYSVHVGEDPEIQNYGSLIIVAGGGKTETNTLWPTTAVLTDKIYHTFKVRGFSDDDIYFMTPKIFKDLNGDGFDDKIIDQTEMTKSKLLSAITEWAKVQPTNGPLFIYLNDHGYKKKFQIYPKEVITAADLNSMLDYFQNETGRPVVVIFEACHSGTFIEDIQGENRIIITSSDQGPSFLNPKISFSQFFVDSIYDQGGISQAFTKSKTTLEEMGSPYSTQSPQIKLGDALDNIYVVSQSVIAPFFAKIDSTTVPTNYDVAADGELILHAEVSGAEDGKVWATIKPKGYMPPPTVGEFVTPEMTQLLTIEMLDDPDGINLDFIYTGSTSELSVNGEYDLIIFAANSDGVITHSDIHPVMVSGGDDNAKPAASFTYSPSFPKPEQELAFTNTSSDFDGEIIDSEWDFGDGASSNEDSPTHMFTQAGTYAVTLTIWDDGGNSATTTQTLVVSDESLQTLTLSSGWNLVGAQTQIDMETTFSNQTQCMSVWKWQDSNWAVYLPAENDGGAAYAQAKGFFLLEQINPGEGFWVNATTPLILP